jgi:hypothetical protein
VIALDPIITLLLERRWIGRRDTGVLEFMLPESGAKSSAAEMAAG